MEFYIILLMSLPLVGLVVVFPLYLINWARDQEASRYHRRTRFKADLNGNYEYFYDDFSGRYYQPEPGNSPVASQFIVMPGGTTKALPVSRPASSNEIKIRAWTDRMVEGTVQPERSEIAEFEAERLPEPVQALRSDEEIKAILSGAKQRGEVKQDTITAVTGAKKGGSKAYQYWSAAWDALPGKE